MFFNMSAQRWVFYVEADKALTSSLLCCSVCVCANVRSWGIKIKPDNSHGQDANAPSLLAKLLEEEFVASPRSCVLVGSLS